MDGRNQASDLSAAPVEERVAEGASREDIRGPVGDGLSGLALEAGAAAGAIAAIALGIADVVEVDAIHTVVAHHLQQRVGFQGEVIGVGRAKPVDRLSSGGDLGAVTGAQVVDERLGRADQVPVDLPHMNLQAPCVGGVDARGDLVAIVGELGRVRQERAVVVGQAAAEHVGENGGEAVRHEGLGGRSPIAGERAGGLACPKSAELRRNGPQAQEVRLLQMTLGGLSREDRLRVIGCSQGGEGEVAVGRCHGKFRFCQRRAESSLSVAANAGHRFRIGEVRPHAPNSVDGAGGCGRPNLRQEMAHQAQQRIGFPVGIVAKQNMGHEVTVVAGQPRRVAGRGAMAVQPGGGDAGVKPVGHGVGDIPGGLLHLRRQARDRGVGK